MQKKSVELELSIWFNYIIISEATAKYMDNLNPTYM